MPAGDARPRLRRGSRHPVGLAAGLRALEAKAQRGLQKQGGGSAVPVEVIARLRLWFSPHHLEAIVKKRDAKKWLIGLSDPVEPDVFIEMLGVFAEASGALAHTSGPMTVNDIFKVDEGSKKLANTPLTHGMQAVNRALSDRKIVNRQGYLARLGTISQIFVREDLFGDFMDPPDPETGHRMIAESLIRAAATARYKLGMKAIGYDLDDVLEKARALEDLPHADAHSTT
jgi:hypothetical protein